MKRKFKTEIGYDEDFAINNVVVCAVAGNPVTISNIKSFSDMQKAVCFETVRQCSILGVKNSVRREHRKWDARRRITVPDKTDIIKDSKIKCEMGNVS